MAPWVPTTFFVGHGDTTLLDVSLVNFCCALLATHHRHLVNPVIIDLFTKSDQQPNHVPIITQHKRQAAKSTEMGSNTKVVRLVICFISKGEPVFVYGFVKNTYAEEPI